MKTMGWMLAALLSVGLMAMPAGAEPEPVTVDDEESEGITQGQLAQMLAQKLGYFQDRLIPLHASDLECIQALMSYGIFPAASLDEEGAGWDIDAPVTMIDFTRILVRIYGLQDEVEDPSDDAAWVAALRNAGVSADSVLEGVQSTLPVYQIMTAFPSFSITQDPLYKNPVAHSDVKGALDAINLPMVGEMEPLPAPTPVRRDPEPDPVRPQPVTPTFTGDVL